MGDATGVGSALQTANEYARDGITGALGTVKSFWGTVRTSYKNGRAPGLSTQFAAGIDASRLAVDLRKTRAKTV